MFRKTIVLLAVFLALVANHAIFSQSVTIDTALANAAKEIAESVPKGAKIAVLNISSDYSNLSDYIINELIVNLVNTRAFQVVPRSEVELGAARREFGFQMTGNVSDESQKNLGQFLGADTIISGSVTRDSANSYRVVINAINLESFTYQASYRASIQNNRQLQAIMGSTGGNYYEDYTTQQRIGMGALNMFFGIGSIMQKQHIGWVVTGVESFGVVLLAIGLGMDPKKPEELPILDYWGGPDPIKQPQYERELKAYEDELKAKEGLITAGALVIGGAVIFGYIIPFFHHKPNNTSVSQANFPFNLELVSSNNQEANGLRILYHMTF